MITLNREPIPAELNCKLHITFCTDGTITGTSVMYSCRAAALTVIMWNVIIIYVPLYVVGLLIVFIYVAE